MEIKIPESTSTTTKEDVKILKTNKLIIQKIINIKLIII